MRVLQRMRQAILAQRYRISSHANEEMSEDELVAEDIENIVLTGQVAHRFTHDPRGTRYEVVGDSMDGQRLRRMPLSAVERFADHHSLCG